MLNSKSFFPKTRPVNSGRWRRSCPASIQPEIAQHLRSGPRLVQRKEVNPGRAFAQEFRALARGI